MPRIRVVPLRDTLGAQHPNIMLRCMRAVRLLRIDMTTMRLMFVWLFVALKSLEGRCKRTDVQRVMNSLTTDVFVCERDHVDISVHLSEEIQYLVNLISAKLSVAETRLRALVAE